ncbi:MAG TPA: hypothetical protein PK668_20225 [Myxococcota bacterium]|nr:hypothetical protein [Myxococcota bacterium]HRY96156.1 hypothetical protein [Myxococcota bacterium]
MLSPARHLVALAWAGCLVGLGLLPVPRPWALQAVCAALALGALLRPGLHGLFLLAAALWAGGARVDPALGVLGWWPALPTAVALLAGGWLLLRAPDRPGGRLAREVPLAVGLAIVLALLSAGAAWVLLGLRSSAAMSPGSAAWIAPGLLAAALALGLWAAREPSPPAAAPARGPLAWAWARRLELALLLAIAWEAIRLATTHLSTFLLTG